jgi:hypothetical protein
MGIYYRSTIGVLKIPIAIVIVAFEITIVNNRDSIGHPCYTIGYTIGFSKCYDISHFICNACNVDDYANGDVIGYAIVSNISYAIGSAIAIPLAVPLAMSFALPGVGYTIGSSIDYAIVYSIIFAKSSS